jgi:hypothetical protein
VSCAQTVPRLFDTTQEARVTFETVLEPVLFGFEADQDACRFAVTRDDDLVRLGLTKIPRQIVLDVFLHSRFPNCASHDSASDLATIASQIFQDGQYSFAIAL